MSRVLSRPRTSPTEITIFNARQHQMKTEGAISSEHIINNEAVRKIRPTASNSIPIFMGAAARADQQGAAVFYQNNLAILIFNIDLSASRVQP